MYEDIINHMTEAAVKDPVAANQVVSKAFGMLLCFCTAFI
jgi:hypothetical protein